MRVILTELPEVCIIEPVVFGDDRGWFMESFNARRLAAAMVAVDLEPPPPFVQDNHSCSRRGILRGLHFQRLPHAQGKLVRVVRGRIYDVAVDIRRSSPTFGRWIGVELTAENRRQIWVPAGFAHGFLALDDDTEVVYKTTDYYDQASEGVVAWNDPAIAIQWPVDGLVLQLAERDAAAPRLADSLVFE